MIRDLRELSKKDLLLAGGKGANLAELIRANIPVPPGFVITTTAYDRFVDKNSLNKIIIKGLKDKSPDGAIIRKAFIKAPIPKDLRRRILKAYQKFRKRPAAVRSSATAEDLPSAAFAGQQESYLNIIGEKELLNAVRRVWASLWTERAIAYRTRKGIDQKSVKLAVIVQKMIDAEFAGVMFTANPVTGDRKEIVIDANPGPGEAVVSGLVTPDHFIMRRKRLRWRVIEKSKGKCSDYDSKLPKIALIKLAKLGAKIEKHFKSPQDIEWVFAQGKIFIVQSRPITALPEPPSNPSRITKMLSAIMAEMVPMRPYPLDAVVIEYLIGGFIRPALRFWGFSIAPTESLFLKEKGVPLRFTGRLSIRPRINLLLMPLRLAQFTIYYSPLKWRDDPLILELVKTVKKLEKQKSANVSPKELIKQMEKTTEAVFRIIVDLRMRYLPRVLLAMGFLRITLFLLGRKKLWSALLFSSLETKIDETNRALEGLALEIRQNPTLTKQFEDNKTINLLSALRKLKDGKKFLKHLKVFLDKYGYREAGATFFISQPTWKESPEVVLGILKTLVSSSPEVKIPALTSGASITSEFLGERNPVSKAISYHSSTSLHLWPSGTGARIKLPLWQEARDKILENPIFRFGIFRFLFLASLKNARRFYELREDTRFYWMMIVPVLRERFLKLGGSLCKAGILDRKEEIWWLTFDEVKKLASNFPPSSEMNNNLRSIISERKFIFNKLKNTPFVDPRLFRSAKRAEEAQVSGAPGSPGLAEGTARVIKSSSEFGNLRSGEILVAPYTNPAWTPLFQRAAAVVVDTGGIMSHAAIVAREYGIPAVMGTVDGTKKIKNGDKIRVDGTNGEVFASKFF